MAAVFFKSRAKRAKNAKLRSRRCHLEPLEPRCLLANAIWIADTDGFWDIASNWQGGLVPAPGDDVIIRRPAADITVTYRGIGTNAIAGLALSENLVIQSGTSFQWTGGLWTGGGTFQVETGATFEISTPTAKTLNRFTFDNQGTTRWTGGDITVTSGNALFINGGSALFDVQTNDDFISSTGGRTTFENRGRLIKSAGIGDSTLVPLNSSFTNTGLVEALTGVLAFDSLYTQLGSPGTETRLAGGNLRFTQGSNIGAGRVTGTGTIFGNLTNTEGTIAPGGDQFGIITVIGNFTVAPLTPLSVPTLDMQIAGTTPGVNLDQLIVQQTPESTGGLSTLSGNLNVTAIGISPTLGDRYPLIIADSTSGKFLTTDFLPAIPPNTSWLVDYAPDGTAIQVVDALADLSITMTTNPATARVGEILTFRINTTNAGPNGANNVLITDVLPLGVDFVPEESSAVVQYDPITRTATANLGFFAVGAIGSVNIAVRPNTSATGATITNTAVVSSDEPDPDRTNNTATVEVPFIGATTLTVTQSAPTQSGVGNLISYVITVINNGPSQATNVTVADVIPRNTIFRPESSFAGLTLDDTGQLAIASLGTLRVGDTVSYVVSVEPTVATSGKTITNQVIATSTETDQPSQSFSQTVIIAAPEIIGLGRVVIGRTPQLVVQFSQPMDAFSASNINNYTLRILGRSNRVIRIRDANYDPERNWVYLTLAGHLSPYRNNQLTISAQPGGLVSEQNIALAGNGSTYPGFNYVKRFSPQQVKPLSFNAAQSARVNAAGFLVAPPSLSLRKLPTRRR